MSKMTEAPPRRITINVPGRAPSPLGCYCHAVQVGNMVILSGQGARDPQTGQEAGVTLNAEGAVVSYDIAVQTRTVIENVKAVLHAAGCTLQDVIEVNSYLADMRDFDAYNRVYTEYFSFENPPARTTIEARPPGKNFVEMRVVALCPDLTASA
jgi:2-aminomuconate deaminase